MVAGSISREIRLFGPERGAAGVRVIEQVGTGNLQTPTQAPIVVIGPFKRGPSGVPIFCSSRKQYNEIFGDKREPRWHLYANSEHYTPDAVDGYYTMAGDNAPLWVIRLDLEQDGKRAKRILKNQQGTPVLELLAGNEGRWAGASQTIPTSTLIVVTSDSFTIHAPNARSNEFVGAKAYFRDVTGSQGFEIIANTAPFENGEVIFSVAQQYDLTASGVHGPITLTGRASYTLTTPLTGTIASPMYKNITGQASFDGRVLTGVGTKFTTELVVNQNVYYQGEGRVITSISSDTTATIDTAFDSVLQGSVLQIDNLNVIGTGTAFDQTIIGRELSITLGGQTYTRIIASVQSPTGLTLASGFPVEVPAGTTGVLDNYWVNGDANSNFPSELKIGNKIIDPNRRGESATVIEIDSTSRRFKLDKRFNSAFNNAQLIKQNQGVDIKLDSRPSEGLKVEVGLGERFPLSHFSLKVYFNTSLVVNIPDASLDPNDTYFVEPLVNDGNVAYRANGKSYQSYVTVKSLWQSSYTTAETNDVRPFNATGKVLEVVPRGIYTVADFDYSAAVGSLMNVSPYKRSRGMDVIRITASTPPVNLEGTVSSNNVEVFGTGTNFTKSLNKGDYLYDVQSNSARKVRFIISDVHLILESPFSTRLPALSKVKKAGWLQTEEGVNLTYFCNKGDRFIIPFAESFEGGYDGDLGMMRPYHYTKFLNPDNSIIERAIWGTGAGLWRMVTPGISLVSVIRMGILYAERTASEYRAEIPPHYNPTAAKAFITQEVGLSEFMTIAFPSYGYITDPLRNGQRLIPLTGDIMGLETFYAREYQGWARPAAGVEAKLSRVNDLAYQVSPGEEADLNNAGIQPLKELYGSVVIFGVESPAIDDIYRFTHVRRTESEMARQFLENIAFMRRLFQPNQPENAEQLRMTLNSYLLARYQDGWFNKFLLFEQAVQVTIETPITQSAGNIDEASRDRIAQLAGGNLTAVINWYPAGVLKNLYFRISPDIVSASYGE
jgi:hypothetical protein